MRHLRTHAASVAIVAGLGILGVGCTDDDPSVDETTTDQTTDDGTDMTEAPTTEMTDAPTSTASPTS